MKKTFFRKFINVLSALAIISQSLTPYAVLLPQTANAQETIVTPAPSVDTPTPTVDQSQTTDIVTPTPTVDQTQPTDTATPTPTDVPTDTVTPTPDQTATPTDTPTVDNNSPPSTDGASSTSNSSDNSGLTGASASSVNTTTPTVTIDPTQDGLTTTPKNGLLSFTILDNVSAPTVDLGAVVSEGSAVLSTDKPDYAPTDTALITGSNLLPNTTYSLHVWSNDSPATSTTANVTTDDKGVFAYAYQLDGTYRPNYSVELKDSAGNVVASTTFTDAAPPSPTNLDQCDPPTGFNPSTYTCATAGATGWVHGNNDGPYTEGDTVPYRIGYDNLVVGHTYTVTIQWDTTKSGKHALDYLKSYNATITTTDPCDGMSSYCPGSAVSLPIPTDTFMQSDPAWIANAGVQDSGNITFYGVSTPSTSAYTTPANYSGDTSTSIDISFTAQSSKVLMAWGGHIGDRDDWGLDNSAVNISGSPYHMRFLDWKDTTTNEALGGGNQDRSLSATAVIFPASITIVKDATPNGSTSFGFTAAPSPLSNFSLVDDGTNANTKLFSDITNFQTYSVSENTPAGWTLHSIICGVTSSNGGIQTVTLPGVSINLAEGENVTCTFSNNQQPGTLTVNKVTVPANDTTNFSITTSGSGTVTDPSRTSLSTSHPEVFTVTAGTYSVSETAATGWSEDVSNCQNISVAAGGSASCTITNTKLANLVIVKNTVGGDGSFDFTTTGSGISNFSLTTTNGTNSKTFSNIGSGSYSVAETAQSGWNLTGSTCDNGNNPSSITINAGQTVTCTFTNTKKGHLIVQKTTDPAGDQTVFTINATGSGTITSGGAGTVTDSTDKDYEVTPGTYSVAETVPAGWSKTGDTCQNVTVAAGETKTCLLTNTKLGKIIVKKHMVGGTDSFGFTGDVSGTISVNDGTLSTNNVLPATYSSVEGSKTGWDLTDISCDDSNSTGSTGTRTATFNVEAGETVTCTFTNTKRGSITIVKNTTGGDGTFNYTSNFGVSSLTTTGGTVSQTVDNLVPGSNYNISETVPTGWDLDTASCTNGTIGAITVVSGQNTTCTFSNIKRATIIVKKVMVGGTDDFNFTGSPAGTISVSGNTIQSTVVPGQYVSTENPLAGWDLTSVSCDDRNSVGSINNHNATFNAEAGETVTCTFTNTKKAHLIVHKTTDPANNTTSFTITASGNGTITGNATRTNLATNNNVDYEVTPGTYSVSETAATGWSEDDSDCQQVAVSAGQTANCTIVNTKLGTLKIIKNTVGGNGTFDFTTTGSGISDFTLTTNNGTDSKNFNNINPGTYSVSETPIPSGWILSSATCDNNDNPVSSINIGAGETVTCTFTNTKLGHIIVDKITNPTKDSQSFDFTTTGTGYDGFSLADQSTPNDQELVPGTYSVSETAATGWDQTSAVCDNDQTPENIDLQAGQTVTCTFTNTKRGHIIVDKVTDPSEDPQSFDFELSNSHLDGFDQTFSLTDLATPYDSGAIFPTGEYVVRETVPAGWDQTGATCKVDGQEGTVGTWDQDAHAISFISLGAGQTIHCTFTNTKRGKVIVTKYNSDTNEVLSGWTINLDSLVATTGANGQVTFDNLIPDNYALSEDIQTGWAQTSMSCNNQEAIQELNSNQLGVSVSAGETVNCSIYNHNLTPKLTITKVNDTLGATKSDGDTVGYTLTVTIDKNGGPAENLTVTDLLPEGFHYNGGSYSASSADQGVLSISEPTYHSPGVWTLAPYIFQPGDVITLKYTATIDGSQAAGTYYDNAWAQANPVNSSTVVLADATTDPDLGFINDPNFVGTTVLIAVPNDQSTGFKANTTQDVLGASTFLPATGEDTLWVIIATLLGLSGFGTLIYGIKLRKKYVK